MILTVFKRCWILYCLILLVAVFGVDYHRTAVRTVDQLKDISKAVYNFARGKTPYRYVNVMLGVRYYKNIATLVHDPSTAYGAIGFCYYHMKKYPKAIKFYEKAVKGEEIFLGFYYNLGMAYYRTKNFKRAIEAFEQTLKTDPTNTLNYPNVVLPQQSVLNKTNTKEKKILQLKIAIKKTLKMIDLSQDAFKKDSRRKTDVQENKFLENLYYYPPFRVIPIKGEQTLLFI